MDYSKLDVITVKTMDFKTQRLKKGLSQRQVAMAVGISINAYRDIELGTTKQPKKETLQALKQVLDIKE
jgi:transcriptional regulator with XRE-family HTH domain